jgi:hypothetical protein
LLPVDRDMVVERLPDRPSELGGRDEDKKKRRGCYLIGVLVPLVVLLLAAVTLGWLGPVDGRKITEIPLVQNSNG